MIVKILEKKLIKLVAGLVAEPIVKNVAMVILMIVKIEIVPYWGWY